MSRHDLYVIEKRDEEGRLELSGDQPEKFFGRAAITGITEDEMAKAVWKHKPDVEGMHGGNISLWPAFINPRFIARRKTW